MAPTTLIRETERKCSSDPVDTDFAATLAMAAADATHGGPGRLLEPAEFDLSAVHIPTEDRRARSWSQLGRVVEVRGRAREEH